MRAIDQYGESEYVPVHGTHSDGWDEAHCALVFDSLDSGRLDSIDRVWMRRSGRR
jgi:hypothetical protein